jgi:hypothetical protein
VLAVQPAPLLDQPQQQHGSELRRSLHAQTIGTTHVPFRQAIRERIDAAGPTASPALNHRCVTMMSTNDRSRPYLYKDAYWSRLGQMQSAEPDIIG